MDSGDICPLVLVVPCWGEVTCLLRFPRERFVTRHLHPVLSPSQPCHYPLFFTSPFLLACLLALSCGPLILARTVCVMTGLELGMRARWAHLSVHHWRRRHCFLHRAFIPPFWGLQTITETGCLYHPSEAYRPSQKHGKKNVRAEEKLSSGHTLYKQSYSSCGCMHRTWTRLDLLTTNHGLGKGTWVPFFLVMN